jgi:predicted transcriptional regulator of viral defense system
MRIEARYNIQDILTKLAQLGVFTIKDAVEATGLKEIEVKWLLPKLRKRRFVEKIEKGKYFVIPPKIDVTLNEYIIANMLVKPSAVAYWSALSFHEFTEQIPQIIYVQTTSRKKKQELDIFGVKYKIIRIKPEKFFGFHYVWIESYLGRFRICVTNREKTIVDCLDKPKYCGGIAEVIKALETRNYDVKRLSEYAIRLGNSAVIRRLGYLCDALNIEIELPQVKTRNYVILDPTLPKQGKVVSKWRIIDNVGVSNES